MKIFCIFALFMIQCVELWEPLEKAQEIILLIIIFNPIEINIYISRITEKVLWLGWYSAWVCLIGLWAYTVASKMVIYSNQHDSETVSTQTERSTCASFPLLFMLINLTQVHVEFGTHSCLIVEGHCLSACAIRNSTVDKTSGQNKCLWVDTHRHGTRSAGCIRGCCSCYCCFCHWTVIAWIWFDNRYRTQETQTHHQTLKVSQDQFKAWTIIT